MAGKGSLPPDLSDLDPLNDPLFKDRNSTNGSRTASVTKNTGSSALPTRPTSTDPLSLLMMDFDDQPQPQRHPIKDHVIDSHDRRHASVLLDLHSTPFASTSTQSVPIPRPSPRRRPSIDYSPPRRLSGIMQQQGPLISLDPSVSSPPLEPFHPASPTAGFAKSALEANENHQRPVRKSTSIEDWSDFQSFQHAPQTRPRQPSITRGWPTSPKRAHSFPLVKEEQHVDEVVAILDSLHPIQLLGIRPGTIQILDEDIAEGVRPALPPRIRPCHRWKLLYSLDAHGTSFTMLYERMRHACDGHGPVLLVVKDIEGNRFGAYINQRLHRYEGYYGDSTCFLFTTLPRPPGPQLGPIIRTWKSTLRNTYYILSDNTAISFGGGDGQQGLWIDNKFEKGYSGRSITFGNDPLGVPFADKGRSFDVFAFEAWAVE